MNLLVEHTLEDAAQHTQEPTVIVGDLNLSPHKFPLLQAATATGEWWDPTDPYQVGGEGLATADAGRKLDYAILNAVAKSAYNGHEHVAIPAIRPHWGILLSFDWKLQSQNIRVWKRPKQLTPPEGGWSAKALEDAKLQADDLNDVLVELTQPDDPSHSVAVMWQAWCEKVEDWWISHADGAEDARGRGKPAVFSAWQMRPAHRNKSGGTPELTFLLRQVARWTELMCRAQTCPFRRLAIWRRLGRASRENPFPPDCGHPVLAQGRDEALLELRQTQDKAKHQAIASWRSKMKDQTLGRKAMWKLRRFGQEGGKPAVILGRKGRLLTREEDIDKLFIEERGSFHKKWPQGEPTDPARLPGFYTAIRQPRASPGPSHHGGLGYLRPGRASISFADRDAAL